MIDLLFKQGFVLGFEVAFALADVALIWLIITKYFIEKEVFEKEVKNDK